MGRKVRRSSSNTIATRHFEPYCSSVLTWHWVSRTLNSELDARIARRKVLPLKTVLLLIFAAALAVAADNASVAGKWHVHTSMAGNENDSDCTFVQKDADLTGTCTSDQGSVNITGKVDGKKVTWSYKSEYNGTPLTVNHEGTLTADNKITGTATVPEFSVDGDFTATQAK